MRQGQNVINKIICKKSNVIAGLVNYHTCYPNSISLSIFRK